MTHLDSLRPQFQAAVFGASGGIGKAIAELLAEDPRSRRIFIGSRSSLSASPKCWPFAFDLTNEESIGEAAATIATHGEIDLVIIATGVLHTPLLKPEKSFRSLDPEILAHHFAINAIGPALIVKHMLPLLPRAHKSVFAALSARVGSISDNHLGGWYGYRASKAALNQFIRTSAIELARKNRNAVCVTLHPGSVDTPLSKPFQNSVPAGKLFTAQAAAQNLLEVINLLTPAQSGGFFAWTGHSITH